MALVDETINGASGATSQTHDQNSQQTDEEHHNHPLCIHPLNTQGSVLISIKLQGSKNYSLWSKSLKIDRCNAIVFAWIMNTVSKYLVSAVIYGSDTHAVWEDLRERFDKVNASRAFYLHRENAPLTQGTSFVLVYFTRLKELWDEFGALKSSSHDFSLPNINRAYAMIIIVESQRKNLQGNNMFTQGESSESALMSNRIQNIGGYSNLSGSHGSLNKSAMQSNRMSNNGGGNGGFRSRNNSGKSSIYCDHCKFRGHTKDNCYKLHGYPSDYKYKKKGGYSNTYANNATNTGNLSPDDQGYAAQYSSQVNNVPLPSHFNTLNITLLSVPPFTSEQYSQILNMLGKGKGKMVDAVANTAKVDSAETSGTSGFKYNLLSLVSKITTELDCAVLFFPYFCVFPELSSGKVIGIGKKEDGLYILKASSADVVLPLCNTSSLWHKRLGYASLRVVRFIPYLKNAKFTDHVCTMCPIAKQTRSHFLLSHTVSPCVFDLVLADVWGPYRVPTHNGRRYFLTPVNDYLVGTEVKCLRTANGIELLNEHVRCLLKDKVVERRHGSILDIARALRFQTGVPPSFPVIDLPNYEIPSSCPSTQPTTVTPDVCGSSPTLCITSSPAQDPSTPITPTISQIACLIPDPEPRQSSRTSKPPIWMHGYFVPSRDSACSYPLSNYMSYDNLSPTYKLSLAAFSTIFEPRSYTEASKDPLWVAAMKAEISALEENKT
ncbi:uncharacterized protein LOC132613151 [Lycium barbarum]|uniref:uncharacterized protein LOC132613151 n=1 Tax=Lycium barbarum TaxID=112863 RepID=UPI00293E9361|nr:uncharacterized protein LOC132613151 [Lycium barbarum]